MPQITDDLTFGDLLKRRRRALDLTQDELAERVGYASPTLQKIERGVRRPSRVLAVRLADALAIPEHERPRFLQLARVGQAQAADQDTEQNDLPYTNRPRAALPPVALVGREAERAALSERLRDGGQRLITLVGPGGIGKTSLALQVAADLAADSRFTDGVVVALLAAVTVAGELPLAIAEALGMPLQGARPAVDQLLDALRGRALLLVLDNLEHLLGPGEGVMLTRLIGRILAEAPAVQILATSRERLRLRDERMMAVSGLAFPPTDTGPRVERAAAVQLFVERAQRVASLFALSADNRAAVAHICRRLEGLPLAIELAASWTRALTPHEIALEIDRSLDFLAGDDRDTPDRHRSLRAALDHSWRLLDAAERHTLARLSVFRGGCERAAATDVVGATLPILTALIDKSLVQTTASAGMTHYTLHELVRQYAAEHLATDPADQRATEARHAAYYADLLQRSLGAQTGEPSPATWAILTRDIDNLRAAWTRAATSGAAATVLAMAPGLMTLYDYHGWLLDGATLFGRAADALQAVGQAFDGARGLCLGVQGYFLYRMGRLADGVPLLQQGVAIAEAAGRSDLSARLLIYLGTAELFCGHFLSSQQQFAQSAQLAELAGDDATRLWALFFQGTIALYTGDTTTAEGYFTICIDSWRSQGYGRGVASTLIALGEIARLRGDLAVAEQTAREALQITSLMHDAPAFARCLRELGALALAQGELDEARYLLTESCERLGSLGDQWAYGRSQYALIRLDIQCGDHRAAWRGCAELLRGAHSGDVLRLVDVAYCIALLLVTEGSELEALAVLIALDGKPGEYATLKPAAHLRTDLEQRLGPARRAAAVEQARGKQLLPWLEQLCARPPAPTPLVAPTSPASDAPIVPAGALFVAETGETLSRREVEVLRLLISGVSNQVIADTLIISPHTAKRHVANILGKLGATTRTEAAARARGLGLI